MRIPGAGGTSTLVAVALLADPLPVLAHGFGQRYDLPVPLGLYLSGAAAAVAFSFVVIAAFGRGAPGVRRYPRLNLLRTPVGTLFVHPAVLFLLKLASVFVFVVFLLAGLVGDQHPMRNVAPALAWIIWWVGVAYVSALVGDLWALINPWKVLFGWAEALYRRLTRERELALRLPYPERLGVWPGLALLLAFSWVELVWPGRIWPNHLAGLALAYSVVTWTGMYLFGRERWLRHGEAFSLAFGVLARFAPSEVRVARQEVCRACGLGCRDRAGECINCYECFGRADAADREWNLRPWAVGLLRDEPVSPSMAAFVLVMLSAVTFDGFMATPAWAEVEGFGARPMLVQTLGLLSFPVLLLGAYLAVSRLMRAAGGGSLGTGALARRFVFTLVPIALAYHLAHYLSFLLIQGQLIIPLASDPFGFGWNLFGTAGYRIDIGVVGARFAWYTAVSAIVLGHIVAVSLAHVVAVRVLAARGPAVRSQYPMSALMVGYTVVSLWILAQPIVESGVPSTAPTAAMPGVVRVPPEAVLPEPGTGRFRPVGEGRTAEAKLTYRMLTSAFHDGTPMTVADLLYAYAFAFRWGAPTAEAAPSHDPAVEQATALVRGALAGVRVVGVDRTSWGFGEFRLVREIPVIEVYLDPASGDSQQLAAVAPPWSALPWHVLALMEAAVSRGWAAFSREEADRRGVAWLDLVRDDRLTARLASLVEAWEREGYVPAPLEAFATAEDARKRWAALRAFHARHGHFLVTNGPYRLEEWSSDLAVLKVFRDLSYPLGVGSFDAYAIPRRAYIAAIETVDGGLRIWAEVERVEKFQRTYEVVRVPLERTAGGGQAPEVIESRYVVIDPAGRVRLSGRARFEEGALVVDLRDRLEPGTYTVLTALYLNENFTSPDIRRVPYRVGLVP